MQQTKIYIVHGYTAAPEHHWFPWLQKTLTTERITVEVLAMPDSMSPDPEAWLTYMNDHVEQPDQHTFFVGHSLGCITILKYLERLDANARVGGVIMVSGFGDPLSTLPELDRFVHQPVDYKKLITGISERIVIAAEDDAIVPIVYSERFAQCLQAELHRMEKGGHFLDRDGYVEFPLVRDLLLNMVESASARRTS
ncbi:RBBP9/YdeN family alpha/beta hydrolase [Paenibacillus wenxiniae]|uniref:RBBP9/YdeN family alpha/beta hydrolase n=1 Tax=Paenibacillus wenxiniae TaxID=1636843 RepID=A0ABW4RHE5_9BACL